MSAVIARAAEEYVKQPTPEKWIFATPGKNELVVDQGAIPPCIEKACSEVISTLDLSDEALVAEFNKKVLPSGAEVPPFGAFICSEQHNRYMIPYPIKTPPLLALILSHRRNNVFIPDYVAVTDAHMMYRTYLAAIEFKARSAPAGSELPARVQAANKAYETFSNQAEDWMADMLQHMPNFKEIASLAPSDPSSSEVPNFAKYYSKEGLEQFARAHVGLMNTLVSAVEIAIMRALGVRPSASKAAQLINADPDNLPGKVPAHYEEQIRAQEVSFRSQCRTECKDLMATMTNLPTTEFVASLGITPEFIYLNYGLMCMALMR